MNDNREENTAEKELYFIYSYNYNLLLLLTCVTDIERKLPQDGVKTLINSSIVEFSWEKCAPGFFFFHAPL